MSTKSPTLPEEGDLVAGRYRVIYEVGRGGYGAVYRAQQEAIDRHVALKFLLPDVADDPTEVERFRREVFHASGLDHPHTVTVYDYGKSPAGLVYVVMEFLEGHTLHDHIHKHGALQPPKVRALLEQVLGSLDEAHQRELIHRDLKPDNIFLCHPDDDRIDCRVLDFGLSKFVGDPDSTMYRGPSLTEEGEICGTPQYMSPEHAYGEKVGPAGDIYSLGLVVYEALMGEPPFEGNSPLDVLLKQVKEPMPSLPDELADTAAGQFVEKATPKESEERFADADTALQWLLRQPVADNDEDSWTGQTPKFLNPRDPTTEEHPAVVETAPMPPLSELDASPRDGEGDDHDGATVDEHAATVPDDDVAERSPSEHRHRALHHFELRVAQTPLIGRDDVLDELDRWLDDALRSGGVFALTGDDGIGKSCVLDTWCSRLRTRPDLQILRAKHTPDDPDLGGLERLFDPVLDPRADATELTVGSLSAERALQLGRLFDTARQTDQQGRQAARRLVHGLSEVVDGLCRARPTVMVFDDLHSADPVTRRFFDNIHDSLADRPRPLAVIATARSPETIHPWNRLPNAPALHRHLAPLDHHKIERLLDRLLPVDRQLADGIAKLAGGNPALLMHICRYLLERKDLVEYRSDRQLWALCDPSTPVTELVPVDLRQLVIERANHHLRRADDEAGLRAVLHRAVLLGEEFEAQLLEAILRQENRPDLADRCAELLETLADIGLLQSRNDGQPSVYAFARPLHRASLVRMVEHIDDWRRFHRLAADELIGRREHPPFPAHRIAAHLQRAGEMERALSWWIRAAERAETEGRFRQALRWLHRSIREPSTRDTDAEKLATIHLREGRIARRVGEVGRAEDALRIAADYASSTHRTDLRAQALEHLADVVFLQGRLDESAQLFEDVDGLYDVLDDDRGRTRVRVADAKLAVYRGDHNTAIELFDHIEQTLESGGDERQRVRCLIGRSRCLFASGQLEDAARRAQQARSGAAELEDRQLEAYALIEAAHISLRTDGIETAEGLAHQALTLGRREDDVIARANAHLALGVVLRRSTNLDRAHFHADRARELHEATGHMYGILKDLLLSAELAWMEGELERALLLAEDASSLHHDLGDRHGWALSTVYRCLFLIEMHRFDDARELLDEIADTTGRDELGLYEPYAVLYGAMIDAGRIDLPSAREGFAEAHRLAETSHNREVMSLAATGRGKLDVAIGDLDRAEEAFQIGLREAEHLGHSYASMFALIGAAFVARIRGRPDELRDHITRLRTYLASPHTPDMQIGKRLRRLRLLVEASPQNPHRDQVIAAIDELHDDLPRK